MIYLAILRGVALRGFSSYDAAVRWIRQQKPVVRVFEVENGGVEGTSLFTGFEFQLPDSRTPFRYETFSLDVDPLRYFDILAVEVENED